MKHSSRFQRLGVVLAVISLLAVAAPAFAGGWAVTTLDQLPTQVVAGQPLHVGFVVRQHGQHPIEGLEPQITAINSDSGESFGVAAKPQGRAGHYVATLNFPSAGKWDWEIDAFGFPQPMPALEVSAASGDSRQANGSASSLPMLFGGLGLLGVMGGLLALARTRAPWAAGVVLVAAMTGSLSVALAGSPVSSAASPAAPASDAEVGRALFIAKGCIMCHRHDAVSEARKSLGDFSIGPNLTKFSSEYNALFKWLHDPSAIRPGTAMPTLGLSDEEIDALIAFLNAGTGQ